MNRGSSQKPIATMAVLTMLIGIAACCLLTEPSKAAPGSQSEPIMDQSLVGSIEVSDNIFQGYPMTVSYALPSLPGRSIENITLQVEYDSTMHTLYTYNRTTATVPPNSSFVWTPTLSGTASGFVLDILVLNLTEGRWYSDEDRRWITPMLPSGMVGAANATPTQVDNSGTSMTVIAWTVHRELSFISEMEFNLFNKDGGIWAFSQDKGLSTLYTDPQIFYAMEAGNRTSFWYNWTVPRDQSPGGYTFNVTAMDMNGYSESWNGTVTNITWDQRPPVLLNGTILMEEDSSAEIDLHTRFEDVNMDAIGFFLSSFDENLTVVLNGSVLSIHPTKDWTGTANLSLMVDDDHTNLSHIMTVIVNGINDAPAPFNDTIVIDWNTESLIILIDLFSDPEGDAMDFTFIGAGPHLEAVYAQVKAELSLTPEDGWIGNSYILVNATDAVMARVHNITVEVAVPEYYLSLRVVYESAGDHIPVIPPSLRPIRITFSSEVSNYTIVVTELEPKVLRIRQGSFTVDIDLLIPIEFQYNETLKRPGYQAPVLSTFIVSKDNDLPLSIPWKIYSEPKATWDDIAFDRTFMNRTDGVWTITIPVSTNRTGYDEIHLKLVVINDPDRNETLHFDFFWDDGKRAYILELKKNDLKEFEEGELSYYFTDGMHRTQNDQTVFITKDSKEDSIVVIAILLVLIILVMVALVLIMRKPAEEEDSEISSRETADRSCPSCGERSDKDARTCSNCGSVMEE